MTNKDSTNNQGGAAASKSNMDNDSVEDAVIIEDENKEKNKVAASKNISGRSASDATSKAGGKEVSKKSTALSITALLIALLAVAAAAYIAWLSFQQAEQLQSLTADSKSYYQQTQTLQRSLQGVQNESIAALTLRDRQRETLSLALQDANLIIDSHDRRLRSLTSTTTDDWRLAEVEYLLRLANQRILISKDSVTALGLLATADQILLTLADPRFFAIRKAIAEDRAALLLVGQQDLDGVFLRLSALTQQLDKLPLIAIPNFETVEEVEIKDTDDSAVNVWRQKISDIGQSTWQELKGLVVINQRNANIKPLLPPDQQYYLRGNLQLMINQSQLALLDGRQAVYSDSLIRAESWLQEYFASDSDAIQSVIADLQQLQKIKVDAEFPDIAHSLLAVKQFLSEQRQDEVLGNTEDATLEKALKSEPELSIENIEAAL